MPRYNPAELEPRWQAYWEKNNTFATPRLPQNNKLYALDMFPYPSGDGLHVGHPEGYTATDIVCRYARMCGRSVMHPMGFDSFGLPAEEHAVRTGTHPRIQTEKNINTFRRQLKMLGFSYDWDRELATTDTEYFRWTQWIFTQIYDTWFDEEQLCGRPIAELPIPRHVHQQGERAVHDYQARHRLAYQSEAPVNWCPALGTVLANEEVIDGRSEVGGHLVERRPLRQWMLRITAYADRLAKDLDLLDWPDNVKALQRNWIGRSTGAEVDFFIKGRDHFEAWKAARKANGFPESPPDDVLRVYTTRPDTLFGATYMVIAPEHPLSKRLTTAENELAVATYCQTATAKSDLERTELSKEKTGVFSGSYAINPVNGAAIPIWIADYVLISYGTGAIMAVPAHDTRDFEFAAAFSLPVIAVVDPGDNIDLDREDVLAGQACSTADGIAINSSGYDGLTTTEFKEKITSDLSDAGLGCVAVNYKLRDWLFSRQRFWGEPIPILHELDDDGQPTGILKSVDVSSLPIDLPVLEDFRPHGRPDPLLDKACDDWLYPLIEGKRYKRETNTMPQWAGSCWYYLRFLDPKNSSQVIDPEIEKQWMPVDLYVGGAEHAVLHLLYARFWHKVLYDRGVVTTEEPFHKLVNQGMILGEVETTGYQDHEGTWISAQNVKLNAVKNPIVKTTGECVNPIKVPREDTAKSGDAFVLKSAPDIRLDSRAFKMSKSRGNVINPDLVVREYGADSLRLYEMFMGPLPATKPWSMDGVSGVHGFLNRAWRLIINERAEQLVVNSAVQDVRPDIDQNRVIHKTIKAVTDDLDSMDFNTAIARMMEFVNFFTKQTVRPRSAMEVFLLLLSPFAPHICEELWRLLGHDESLAYEPWPRYDEKWLKQAICEIPVQINGKVRTKVTVPADADEQATVEAAMADPKLGHLIDGKTVVKTIVIKGRTINFVIR